MTTDHSDGHSTTAAQPSTNWPRPWDPTQPIDVSGVEGVNVEQELRATKLIEDTFRELPRFADPADAIAAGYVSNGDEGTGDEHLTKGDLIGDDTILDPTAPESLVYNVGENGERTLAGAMFIASARPADDPSLTEWAGPLMTWHKQNNLCWSLDADGNAQVVGIVDAAGNCANGIRAGGETPMVHVWIKHTLAGSLPRSRESAPVRRPYPKTSVSTCANRVTNPADSERPQFDHPIPTIRATSCQTSPTPQIRFVGPSHFDGTSPRTPSRALTLAIGTSGPSGHLDRRME